MKNPFIFSLLLLPLFSFAQTKLITVRHNGASSYYTDFGSAHTNSLAGDTIIFPGGDFYPPSGNRFVITKPVHILGTGFRPDSSSATSTTTFHGDFAVGTMTGGSIQGIKITGYLSMGAANGNSVTGFTSSNCHVMGDVGFWNFWGASHYNCTFSNLIIGGVFNGWNSQGTILRNSILQSGIMAIYPGTLFENNIFLASSNIFISDGYSGPGIINSTFKKNIFLTTYTGNWWNEVGNCLFQENVFVLSQAAIPIGTNSVSNNIYSQSQALLFVNQSGNTWSLQHNYALNPSSPAFMGGGINQAGIYGGSFPWKNNAHPAHPRIKLLQVAPATNSTGNLTVRARVEAQNN